MRQMIMTHKNITAAVRLAVIAALAVATTVLAVDLTKLPPPSTRKGLTYAKDIQPIFQANCFDCHAEKVHKNNLRLDSLAAALKGSRDNSDVIVPGKSDKSDLVINICWEACPSIRCLRRRAARAAVPAAPVEPTPRLRVGQPHHRQAPAVPAAGAAPFTKN